jgi:hypothetical protein
MSEFFAKAFVLCCLLFVMFVAAACELVFGCFATILGGISLIRACTEGWPTHVRVPKVSARTPYFRMKGR